MDSVKTGKISSRRDVSELLMKSAEQLGLKDSPTTKKLLAKLDARASAAEAPPKPVKASEFPERGGVVV